MYADDNELHYCHSQLQRVKQVLQNEVERVSYLMAVNRLKLNVTKSVCMLIGSHQRVAGTVCVNHLMTVLFILDIQIIFSLK